MPVIVRAEYFPGLEMPSDVTTWDNSGSSVTNKKTATFIDSLNWFYNYYQLYSYNYQSNGIFVNFPLNQAINQNNRYVIQAYFNGTYGMKQGNFKQGIALVNSVGSDPFNYRNGVNLKTFICEETTAYIGSTDSQLTVCTIDFIFTSSYNPRYISIPINSTTSGVQNVQFLGYTIQNLGKDYEQDLNNIKTSITDINKNIGNIKNDITNSIDESTNQINENIAVMGNAINDTIKDQFQSCHVSDNLFDGLTESGGYSTLTGLKFASTNMFRSTNFIKVSPNQEYIFSYNGIGLAVNVVEYDENKKFIQYLGLISKDNSFVVSSNTHYITFYRSNGNFTKIMLNTGKTIKPYEEYGEICSNRFDEQIDNANKNHQQTIDTITNSDVDSDSISSLTSTKLPTTGVLSSILNMPIQFFNSLLNNLDTTTCKAVVIPIPFVDSTFTFPCVRSLLNDLHALEFYNAIGSLVGGIALWNYILYMGHQFKRMEDLEDGSGEFGGL